MRPAISPLLYSLLLFAPACGDPGDGDGTAAPTTGTTSTASTGSSTGSGSTGPTTGDAPTSTGEPDTTGTTSPGTTMELTTTSSSTGPDPNCPPVKGEYNDCTDEMGQSDNTLCNWMGDGDNGFITCLNAGGLMGASTCSLVNCELDCHCFVAPATGTAASVCRPMATDKGDSACVLDCSGGATCPDGMVCDSDTCFWPAP